VQRYFDLHWQNLRGAVQRLARQPFSTALTLLVLAIAIALPAGLRVLVSNASALSGEWQSAADFTVYLKVGVDPARARALAREIEARDDVASVQLIERAAALEEFRAHSGFGEALDALDGNPLPDTIVVRPTSVSGDVAAVAAAIGAMPETELVQLDTQWVARMRAILALADRVLDIATALLAAAVAIVVGNTIRLEINNRSAEIEVVKLVGGTDAFIRRPFLYLGVCYGLGGAIVADLLVLGTLALLSSPVRELVGLYGGNFSLTGLSLRETSAMLLGGAVLGWLGAGLATAKHLRAIEPK
jgi:cell division transport system permease protein